MVLFVAITFELRGVFDAAGGGACAAKETWQQIALSDGSLHPLLVAEL